MQLTVFNGSPRGIKSNSRFLIDAFLDGYTREKRIDSTDQAPQIIDIVAEKDTSKLVTHFEEADHILIAFPLYVDSMPGIVKTFIERLQECKAPVKEKHLGFIIQSGFPEKGHFHYLEKYLSKLSKRLGCKYQGTVIKGGAEIIRIPPIQKNLLGKLICTVGILTNLGGVGHLLDSHKLRNEFFELGTAYRTNGEFAPDIMARLEKFQKVNPFGFFLYKTIGENLYWRNLLRKNGAWKERDSRPYRISS